MSVVNDVLKNLDQRHAQEQMRDSVAYTFTHENPRSYWLLGSLLAALCLCAGFALNIWYQVNKNKLSINIPESLFVLDEPLETVQPKDKAVVVMNTPPLPKEVFPPKKVVTKTAQSVAVDKAVTYIKKGDNKATKSILAKTPKVFQDEVKLRLMVKENPSNVLQYIKDNYQDYLYKADLLAMAAQAEQRSNNHESAIELYKGLIVQQPKDARWRAGIAISLEISGKLKSAKHMYALAIKMPNLPLALKNFSKQRLAILR